MWFGLAKMAFQAQGVYRYMPNRAKDKKQAMSQAALLMHAEKMARGEEPNTRANF